MDLDSPCKYYLIQIFINFFFFFLPFIRFPNIIYPRKTSVSDFALSCNKSFLFQYYFIYN